MPGMTWNYRVWKTTTRRKIGKRVIKEDAFDIREVYYKKNGRPWLYSDAMNPHGTTLEELRADLVMMLNDTYRNPAISKRTWKRWRPKK